MHKLAYQSVGEDEWLPVELEQDAGHADAGHSPRLLHPEDLGDGGWGEGVRWG